MSRGLGKIQKMIVDYLEELIDSGMPNSMKLSMMAMDILKMHPLEMMLGGSYAKGYSSLKRAVKTLAQRGIISRYSTPKGCWISLIRSSRRGTLKPGYVDEEAFEREAKRRGFR